MSRCANHLQPRAIFFNASLLYEVTERFNFATFNPGNVAEDSYMVIPLCQSYFIALSFL
jgi:hypothetical protein